MIYFKILIILVCSAAQIMATTPPNLTGDWEASCSAMSSKSLKDHNQDLSKAIFKITAHLKIQQHDKYLYIVKTANVLSKKEYIHTLHDGFTADPKFIELGIISDPKHFYTTTSHDDKIIYATIVNPYKFTYITNRLAHPNAEIGECTAKKILKPKAKNKNN